VVEISKTKNDNFLKIVKDNGGSNVDTKEVSVYDIDAADNINNDVYAIFLFIIIL
jgi:hypothetical protein